MAKRVPVDCTKLTATHLNGLDDDQLGVVAQRIEVQTQMLNRAMRIVLETIEARRR